MDEYILGRKREEKDEKKEMYFSVLVVSQTGVRENYHIRIGFFRIQLN